MKKLLKLKLIIIKLRDCGQVLGKEEEYRQIHFQNIKWTSEDVGNLGIFFGNKNPAYKTFDKIVPKFKKTLAYWKQLTLSKIGKARVVEMFQASRMVYAIKFYPIPDKFQKEIQESIFQYTNFPNKAITIGQKEMWKILMPEVTMGACRIKTTKQNILAKSPK